jgi:pseudaminic acid biosynthesis-associated methylase
MIEYKSEQEEFWAGDFGNEYIGRNVGAEIIAANTSLFTKILDNTNRINSVIEFGANVGLNLCALKHLLPNANFSGIEINKNAVIELNKLGFVDVVHDSILEYQISKQHDLVFTKTVLIHIAPNFLPEIYDKLYASSIRYICIAEYYNQDPIEVTYRGHTGKLFKRDFAGDMLKRFPDLKLVNYGFAYQNDPAFPLDDITWFLLEKSR